MKKRISLTSIRRLMKQTQLNHALLIEIENEDNLLSAKKNFREIYKKTSIIPTQFPLIRHTQEKRELRKT